MNEKRREKIEEQLAKKEKALAEYASTVIVKNEEDIIIDGFPYKLVENYHDGFQIDKLKARFSPILTKYDYIVGDIGYDQLRLRGFYKEDNNKVPSCRKINQLQDYLYEYCDFGCSYFVLKNLKVHDSYPQYSKHSKGTITTRKKAKSSKSHKQKINVKMVKTKSKRPGSRHFVIRKKKNIKTRNQK